MFITKAKEWETITTAHTNLYLALVLLKDHTAPEVYLIPATEWLQTNGLLGERLYGKEKPNGTMQTSKPEWAVNLSNKNLPLLEPYHLKAQVANIKKLNSIVST